MTYLVASDLAATAPAGRFRALLQAAAASCALPGTHNGMAALQARAAGFEALYLSGAAMTRVDGTARSRHHHASTRSPSSSARWRAPAACRCWSTATPATARRSTSCTWSAPSRTPAPARSISRTSCCRRNAAISTTRSWPTPTTWRPRWPPPRRRAATSVIIARTDAAASEGMDGAVARAKLYLEAGADAIFPEALTTRRDVPRLRRPRCPACRCSPT